MSATRIIDESREVVITRLTRLPPDLALFFLLFGFGALFLLPPLLLFLVLLLLLLLLLYLGTDYTLMDCSVGQSECRTQYVVTCVFLSRLLPLKENVVPLFAP